MNFQAAAPTKIVLVVGSGRSGSTVLGNILGSLDGVFCGGEIRYLWERGLRDNRLCGCGEPFRDCPVWSAVLAEAFPGGNLDADRLIAGAQDGTRLRHVPRLLIGSHPAPAPEVPPESYRGHLDRLFRAIPSVTGASLVVDTSKLPPYGHVLSGLPSVDVYAVHLVRDPRATAYSWGREKVLRDGAASALMQRQSPAKAALLWDVWNATARQLWRPAPERYLRIGYEDFVARPRYWVQRILELVGHTADPAAVFQGDRAVALSVSHTVAGNPDRLRRGVVTLRLDDEWTRSMRRRDRALVTALTAPLLPALTTSRAL